MTAWYDVPDELYDRQEAHEQEPPNGNFEPSDGDYDPETGEWR